MIKRQHFINYIPDPHGPSVLPSHDGHDLRTRPTLRIVLIRGQLPRRSSLAWCTAPLASTVLLDQLYGKDVAHSPYEPICHDRHSLSDLDWRALWRTKSFLPQT